MTMYINFQDYTPVSRASIIWTYITIMKDLSFNLSDYIGDYFFHVFKDSQTANKIKIYRQKVQKILSEVLEPFVSKNNVKYMRKNCCLLIDGSRDVSNRNELIIAASYYNEESNEIKRVVFEVIEQNNTTAQNLYETLKALLQINRISFKSIISVITDNAADMSSQQGLVGFLKTQNYSLYQRTCICHNLNLILKHLLRSLKEDDIKVDYEMIAIEDLLASLTSLFSYSYKKEELYRDFKTNFLKEKRQDNEHLYPDNLDFNKLSRYSEIRFLSLGDYQNFASMELFNRIFAPSY